MIRSQWLKAARAQGWREAPSDTSEIRLTCCVQGCPGSICVPVGNTGPVPEPCQLPHHGQYAAPVFHEYQALVSAFVSKRRALGLSQEDIGAAGGFADGHINKLESFARTAQFPILQLWAQTLGLEVTLKPAPLPPATQRRIDQRPHPYRDTSHARALFDDRPKPR